MNALLAGRKPRELAGADAVRFMELRAQFDALAVDQKRLAEAELARRLDADYRVSLQETSTPGGIADFWRL